MSGSPSRTPALQSLQQKVEEYERLKEFSENIVESINVGILAADLTTASRAGTRRSSSSPASRDMRVGRSLAELFPDELAESSMRCKGQTGIHNIYKVAL